MNLTDLVAAVRDQGGFDSSTTGSSTAQIESWVNQAYRVMVAESKFRRSEIDLGVTVANQGEYALPENVVDLEEVYVGNAVYGRVGQKDLRRLKAGSLRVSPRLSGVFAPDFTQGGVAQLELFAAPSTAGTAITAYGSLLPTDLSGAMTPVVPLDFHEDIVDGAIAIGLRRTDERPDLAADYQQRFDLRVEKLRRRTNSRVGGGAVQMKVRGVHF